MIEALNVTDPKTTTTYSFRFGTSDKLVHLTQEQLDVIPYLSALVGHKDDFLSPLNENGEYVLNYPIEYIWFIPILHSITLEQPYTLFNELPEDNNILDTFQLFDYLGVNLFVPPLLKGVYLVLLNAADNDNGERHVEYHHANLSEARNTAAEFIIALSKNEYSLDDLRTIDSIFFLVTVILFNTDVFRSRFRYQTLTIVKECCFALFSKKQQRQLPTSQQIIQNRKIDSLRYLYGDDESLPENFQNTFTWRGVYMPLRTKTRDVFSSRKRDNTSAPSSFYETHLTLDLLALEDFIFTATSNLYDTWFSRMLHELQAIMKRSYGREISIDEFEHELDRKEEDAQLARRKEEARLVRSGCFNTLPKRPNVDKFKHRSGPKPQKLR